jgi:hypothetical protein
MPLLILPTVFTQRVKSIINTVDYTACCGSLHEQLKISTVKRILNGPRLKLWYKSDRELTVKSQTLEV